MIRESKKPVPLLPKSMAVLREQGYFVEKTEHWNAFSRTKSDLFGFVDCIALRRDEVLAVQVTSAANRAARRNKIGSHDNVGRVREAGIAIHLHSWRKVDGRWMLTVDDLS